jgi:hypothetical protein
VPTCQLLVVEPAVVRVADGHQHAQQVVAGAPALRGDHRAEVLGELTPRALDGLAGGAGGNPGHGIRPGMEPLVVGQVDPEHVHGDRQRQRPGHGGDEVGAPPPALQLLHQVSRVPLHARSQIGEGPRRERAGEQPAQPSVRRPVAVQ